MKKEKAIVLLSGGIDSSTTLYYALNKGLEPFCLIFDYNQRHRKEVLSARKIAHYAGVGYKIIKIMLPQGKSVLLDKSKKIPQGRLRRSSIPATYVPARNTIFLSYALCYAETISANYILIGANAVDFSGYPDCRPAFYKAFQLVAEKGTKAGSQGKKIKILTPLINLRKKDIIKMGIKLGVPYELTWSCYRGGKYPCGQCDSCLLREKGFREAGREDPLWKKKKLK